MTIKVRLSGEPDEIQHLVQHLRTEFEVAGGDRAYPNRGSFGVRVYLELRGRSAGTNQCAQSERIREEPRQVEP